MFNVYCENNKQFIAYLPEGGVGVGINLKTTMSLLLSLSCQLRMGKVIVVDELSWTYMEAPYYYCKKRMDLELCMPVPCLGYTIVYEIFARVWHVVCT